MDKARRFGMWRREVCDDIHYIMRSWRLVAMYHALCERDQDGCRHRVGLGGHRCRVWWVLLLFCPKIDVGILSRDDSRYQALSPICSIILLMLGLGPI